MGERADGDDIHSAGRLAQAIGVLEQIARIVGDRFLDAQAAPGLSVARRDDDDDIEFADQFV